MTITLLIENNYGGSLQAVEKTVWYSEAGGEWSGDGNEHILTLGSWRGSGLIRFKENNGHYFSVVVGIGYAQKPWCDVQVNLANTDTGVKLHPEYYGGRLGSESHREITRTTSSGRTVKLTYNGGQAVLEYS
ncbi:uncharacterized protein N7496_007223 [Penicillium cataractarum]|uniref:Uncharacterized protein n=1 Tax=Penicillium cataractarum TaxID=2100454 RepID=A0A9W9S334_9EURO|nr:uncharacterized protein N7496_007223 [Penicillium cataractarum]KAJ5371131.1 hypothetical protein N7496_007223 [Penicillium cataractarum]